MTKKTIFSLSAAVLMLSPLAAQASGSLMNLLTSPSQSLLPSRGHDHRYNERGRKGQSHHAGHGLYERGHGDYRRH